MTEKCSHCSNIYIFDPKTNARWAKYCSADCGLRARAGLDPALVHIKDASQTPREGFQMIDEFGRITNSRDWASKAIFGAWPASYHGAAGRQR